MLAIINDELRYIKAMPHFIRIYFVTLLIGQNCVSAFSLVGGSAIVAELQRI